LRHRDKAKEVLPCAARSATVHKGRTTKKDVGYRPPLVGLAPLPRQVGGWLTCQVARAQRPRPSRWMEELPLGTMLGWLADLLEARYGEDRSIPLGRPILPLDNGLVT
jgi:hypothetical protein